VPVPTLAYAATSGAVLLLVFGCLLTRALGLSAGLYPEEKPAVWAAFSLALLAIPATLSILAPIAVFSVAIVWTTAVALAATLLILDRTRSRSMARSTGCGVGYARELASTGLVLIAVIVTVAVALAAWAYTGGGSIDRWWYLAFVQSWLTTGQIAAVDPFFGTETEMARFAGNAWLLMITLWSRATGLDPVYLYEHAAPVVLAPIALSAAAYSTRAALERRALGLLAVPLSALYWTSGGMVPALARLPEDKVVAALIVAPVLWAHVVRAIDASQSAAGTRRAEYLVAIAVCAVALSSVHALIYGVALVLVFPSLLRARVSLALALAGVLAVASLLPVTIGASALDHIADAESVEAHEHPVGRIHLGRNRLEAVGDDFRISPRLLAHPLTLTALAGALTSLVLRRRREAVLLALPSAFAIVLCFVPAAASQVASVIGPWMVYRVLWAIPVIPLLAYIASVLAPFTRFGLFVPVGLIAVVAYPRIATTMERRGAPARTQLATPADGELPALVAALRELPVDSVIAAAPEISERIPGLTGRKVLAASDRATVVFSGSREDAERRMRARAAILAGLWRRDGERDVAPTHVLFEPGAVASRYCSRELFVSHAYALCAFADAAPIPGLALPDTPVETSAARRIGWVTTEPSDTIGSVRCSPPVLTVSGAWVFPKPGPWSARAPGGTCTFSDDRSRELEIANDGPVRPRSLEIAFVTGRAVDELFVVAMGRLRGEQRWHLRTRRLVRDGDVLRFALPRGEVDEVEVTLAPSRLAFVKLRRLFIELETVPSTKP
jgi:hypothetical protein